MKRAQLIIMEIVAVLAIILATSSLITSSEALISTTSLISLTSPDAITFVIAIGAVISQGQLIYRSGISPLLEAELGIKLGKSTIAKLFSPAVGQGCEPACYWNRRPLYRPSDIVSWAKSRLRPGAGMPTSAENLAAVPCANSLPAAEASASHAAGKRTGKPRFGG